MQLAMNNTGQAALVVQPNNSAIPQDENYQPYNALGIAYFDGGEWIWADVLRGNIKIAWNNREETDTIAISEAGDAILAYARQEREPGEAYNNAIASILRFDRSGILDSQDLGQKDVSYQGSWVDINTSGTVAVQFANYNYDTQLNHPLYVYDGESWIRLPSPPSVFGDPIHFFYNDNDNDNDTAALFLENGLQGYGFDGKEWHTFDPLPGFGSRRNDGHTVRTGPLSYTFVTTFFVTTFVDIQTDTRYYEAHEYDLSNLQSTKVISNELEYFQPRARLFDLDNGRLYLTEHAIEGWYENSSGQISAPTQLLFTEGATNSDMAVNRSGFGIIADNSNFILTAYTIQLR